MYFYIMGACIFVGCEGQLFTYWQWSALNTTYVTQKKRYMIIVRMRLSCYFFIILVKIKKNTLYITQKD